MTHPPLSICARPVLTPKVPAPPPLVPVVLALEMRLGVEVPLAVVGRGLDEGTIVGVSDDIAAGFADALVGSKLGRIERIVQEMRRSNERGCSMQLIRVGQHRVTYLVDQNSDF